MKKNKNWGVWCVRSAASIAGHKEAWLKENENVWKGTKQEAKDKVIEINKNKSPYVHYYPRKGYFDDVASSQG